MPDADICFGMAPGEAGPRIETVCLSHSPSMTQDLTGAALFRAAGDRLKVAMGEFDPTLLIYFGPDHRRAITDVLPCFTVVESADGFGDWDTPKDRYDVPADLARALTAHLLASEIDVAVAGHLRLDHGFGLTMLQLFDRLDAVPVLPIVINCIGAPLASARRVAALGERVGTFVKETLSLNDRVLVVASGGLSHSPPNLAPGFAAASADERGAFVLAAREGVSPQWDEAFLRRLGGADWHTLADLDDVALAGGGTGGAEVRTWIAAAFAGGRAVATVDYEPVPAWFTGMGVAATSTLGTNLTLGAKQ
jgi:2,3-dihydroxyphenylpropionate 1,2-dioxygenase